MPRSGLDWMRVYVLRLGHRPARDIRLTMHVFLAARAFGADGVFYSGVRDRELEERMARVVERWGGPFTVEYVRDWRRLIQTWDGDKVHLTMYGIPIQKVIDEVRGSPRDKLVIVGGEKVPGEIYGMADWNVAVTNQPHSEVSALAVFLHELFGGVELSKRFKDARLRVIPQRRGKKVLRVEGNA